MTDESPGVEPCTQRNLEGWVALRQALWPDTSEQDHHAEARALLDAGQGGIAFLARMPDGATAGFAEASLRRDHVNGCSTSPVAFLEGIYVAPEYRRRGVARLLCKAVEAWAIGLGCLEFASDVELHNTASQSMHGALGFEETERVVYYRKPLSPVS